MTEQDALTRAIVDNPGDDTPRLVYADWLDEKGRAEEAEFMRLDCRLEASGPELSDSVEFGERREELRLWLETHVPEPRMKLRRGITIGLRGWWHTTARGYPRFLNVAVRGRLRAPGVKRIASALEHAFKILPVRWVVFDELNHVEDLAELLEQPVAAALDALTINGMGGDNDLAARLIAESPRLKNLLGLYLPYIIGEAGAAALGRSHHLGRLARLSIDSTNLTPEAIRALSRGEWFHQLHELTFYGTLTSEGFEALCRLPPFPRLHTLVLSQKSFALSAWREFTRSTTFPALKRLELSETDLSDRQTAALAEANGLRLTELGLRQCAIGNEGLRALLEAPWIGSLNRLVLSNNRLSATSMIALAGCRHLAGLQFLDVGGNSLGERGLKSLAKSRFLRGLSTLILGNAYSTERPLAAPVVHDFLRALNLPNLRCLDLSGVAAVDATATTFLGDAKFHNLRRLGLANCKLTDDAAIALLKSPALQNLIELRLDDNDLSAGLQPLTDRSVLPRLAKCVLDGNSIDSELKRKLTRRPGLEVGDDIPF